MVFPGNRVDGKMTINRRADATLGSKTGSI